MAHDQPAFVSGALAFMIVVVINIPLGYVQTLSLGLFSEHTLFAIRGFLAQRLNLLPIRDIEERHSGDFLAVLNADLVKLKTLTGADLVGLMGQCRAAWPPWCTSCLPAGS